MSKITLNAEASAALAAATTQSELCAPDGRELGLFIPPELAREVVAFLKDLSDEPTLEQLKAADAAGGEYTMEDMFKLLEKYK
jgi:hypothetical protein